MSMPFGLLRTRVARRVLLLFVVVALIPVLFMAAASFRAMSSQLREQSEERLRQVSRNAWQAVMQQLILTEAGVRLAAEALRLGGSPAEAPIPSSIRSLAATREGSPPGLLLGSAFPVPVLGAAELGHVQGGLTVLKINPDAEESILAVVRLPGEDAEDRLLWAWVEGDSIWGAAERFASGGTILDFCVLAGTAPLYCRSGLSFAADAYVSAGTTAPSGTMLVSSAEGRLVIGYAELFLEAAFRAPSLRVLVAESTADLYSADLALFRYSFGVALLVGFLVVVLMAAVQVRRTLTPLDALTEGTKRLAEGDLAARVTVTSGDEFGFLARSFNDMASRLGDQFRTLEAGRAVDRAVLSAMNTDGVVNALLERFDGLVSCRSVAVVLVDSQSAYRASLFWHPRGQDARAEAQVGMSPYDVDWLRESPAYRVAVRLEERPPFLVEAYQALGPSPVVVLPLLSRSALLGAVAFEAQGKDVPGADVIARARQVADQATVALDAVRMVGELEEMNWGTLRALARAIDAKSRWTAGHSERVTEVSLQLARRLGLPAGDMDVLHRGGLLHDVGKIGVPAHILDSPDRLDLAGWALVRDHPIIGGRILEPIRAFAPALPIVRQHHERWDGQGYPNGLSKDEIHPLARVLAVADTYDAMASPRPYRDALAPGVALAEIRDGAGTQFEPAIVTAFLAMMEEENGLLPLEAPARRYRHG
ncbi:MAG: HD domain-containing protein [Longimicrobiales bacterium]|nr:HD domain-containing protein [Longimicrobiales bacterium]